MSADLEFLKSAGLYEIPLKAKRYSSRPHVTLTFAQSLDAKIAGARKQQLAISGRESLVMTHWMRTLHDAILIGIGTAINDNPQLNTRHLPSPSNTDPAHRSHMPRPIILDSSLRTPPSARILENYQKSSPKTPARRPWILCTPPPKPNLTSPSDISAPSDSFAAKLAATLQSQGIVGVSRDSQSVYDDFQARKAALERAGARVIEMVPDQSQDEGGVADLEHVLRVLKDEGIESIMVEGGSRIISAFLAAKSRTAGKVEGRGEEGKSLVDTVILTLAPIFLGEAGLGYGLQLGGNTGKLALKHVATSTLGQDVVAAFATESE